MGRAAEGEAAGAKAALAAECKTDIATLARVAAALHDRLGGTLPLLLRERPGTPGAPLECRTVTPLRWAAEARQ
jgi:hypothetical protein